MTRMIKMKYSVLPLQVKAAFWFLVCSFLQKGISMITMPLFTRLMTTAEYGQFSVFNSWLDIFTVLITLKMSAGVYTQGLVKFESERDIYSSSLQGLTLVLSILWIIVYLLFHSFWDDLLGMSGIQMLALLFIVWTGAVFGFWAGEKRVSCKYQKLVMVTLLVSIAKPALGIFFVVNSKDKVTARILSLAFVEFFSYIWLFFSQMKKGKVFFSWKFWRYALVLNIPLIPHYLAGRVLNSADRIMIQSMVSESKAGIYSLAYSISMIMMLFNDALLQTMSPWFYEKIKERKVDELSNIAYLSLICIAIVNVMLIVFAPEIVKIFAPQEYYEAIWVIPPIAMSVYFEFAYNIFAYFEFYYEKTKLIMSATMAAAVLNIALNYIFIQLFGYCAAGYTTLICCAFSTLFHYFNMKKICKKSFSGITIYENRILLAITSIFLGIGFGILFLYKVMWPRYFIILLLMIIIVLLRKRISQTVTLLVKSKKSLN